MWLSCVFISLWSLFRVRFCSLNMNAKKEVYYETNLQRKRQSKSYIHILDGRRCRRFWCIHSVLDSIKSDDDELGEPMGNTLKSSSLDLIRRIKSNEKKVNITTRSHPWKWKWNKSFNVQMSTFDRWWFQMWDLYVFLLSAMLCFTSFLVFSFFLFALRSSIFFLSRLQLIYTFTWGENDWTSCRRLIGVIWDWDCLSSKQIWWFKHLKGQRTDLWRSLAENIFDVWKVSTSISTSCPNIIMQIKPL